MGVYGVWLIGSINWGKSKNHPNIHGMKSWHCPPINHPFDHPNSSFGCCSRRRKTHRRPHRPALSLLICRERGQAWQWKKKRGRFPEELSWELEVTILWEKPSEVRNCVWSAAWKKRWVLQCHPIRLGLDKHQSQGIKNCRYIVGIYPHQIPLICQKFPKF